ncbi:hypothetical protein GOP47_0016702 [Adiantum capillus-veneris]|uniref:Uncharacterized protein n=1 Tax=Adiantum capillus-veneris TaxID=13818 RepID=A0A9D4UIJ9_ADICA|nr:hypothetical protein GOP47_0016702 [Adiantum capillus-veneris]
MEGFFIKVDDLLFRLGLVDVKTESCGFCTVFARCYFGWGLWASRLRVVVSALFSLSIPEQKVFSTAVGTSLSSRLAKEGSSLGQEFLAGDCVRYWRSGAVPE